MDELRDPVVIGFVGAPHGVRGTIRVRATGAGRHLREGLEPVVAGVRRRILRSRATPKGFLVDLDGIADRSEAGTLRGEEVLLDRGELDDLEENEFYVEDLVGTTALDGAGTVLGEVVEVLETPVYEMLLVRGAAGERYVPFTLEHVPEVDLGRGRVFVCPPEV